MSIQTRLIDYEHDGVVFEGLLAWDDSIEDPRPGVMLAHTIAGRSELEENKALALAELGDIGFAIDVYGKGTRTTDADANRDMMMALRNDRPLLQQRLRSSLAAMSADWQLHAYGNTTHAFTNPKADYKEAGKAFSESANRRSWQALQNFLVEIFSEKGK